MKVSPVITIDGASGTGKGVVSQRLAKILHWHLLDSGAIYRVLALAVIKANIAFTDEDKITQLAYDLNVKFREDAHLNVQIYLNNEEVTAAIRTEQIGNTASIISAFAKVRQALLDRQRAFRQPPGLVCDGRDMGTIIFPDAVLKVFLMASPEQKARRRYQQLKELGNHVTLSALIEELRARDLRDQQRAVAPLKPAEGALIIDTDPLSIDEVVDRIMLEVKRIGLQFIN